MLETRHEKADVEEEKLFEAFEKEERSNKDGDGLFAHCWTTYESFVEFLYRPTDPASLGVVRALFGLCMIFDVIEERGFADVDLKWGDPKDCHFPLVDGITPPSLPWIILLYTIMWLGSFGIALGFRFKVSCACFVLPYWYLFILDKSYWNNHTYLYGLVASLLWCTDANKYLALDATKNTIEKGRTKENESVSLWNYLVLKYQFFVLYFLAGLKKSGAEWLDGYAMRDLSRHWVFDPFKIFFATEHIDFLVVHWFTFIFDLTVAFWMLFEKTRIPAIILCSMFHFMNSRLFAIGMFPYVCLATLPLFCSEDWPRKLDACVRKLCLRFITLCRTLVINDLTLKEEKYKSKQQECFVRPSVDANDKKKRVRKVTWKQRTVGLLLLAHVALQLFLPYSHFVTKGYNNWVPGLYGYSWDMMVHTWDTVLVVTRIHDNENNEDRYLDPEAWVQTDRWTRHGDMARQYAFCLKKNLMRQRDEALAMSEPSPERRRWSRLSTNLSIYMDVWCSLNGRFQQRVYDPNIDMLQAEWHPLKSVSYAMPLLTQYNSYRKKMDDIQQNVYSWSDYTDVLFVADFPGLQLDNYITNDFANVTLTVLEGEISHREEGVTETKSVPKGQSVSIKTGNFHAIKTISQYPACYMYTYINKTRKRVESDRNTETARRKNDYRVTEEFTNKINALTRTIGHMANAFFNLVYDVPMVRRVRMHK